MLVSFDLNGGRMEKGGWLRGARLHENVAKGVAESVVLVAENERSAGGLFRCLHLLDQQGEMAHNRVKSRMHEIAKGWRNKIRSSERFQSRRLSEAMVGRPRGLVSSAAEKENRCARGAKKATRMG